MTVEDRLLRKLKAMVFSDCIEFVGFCDKDGYGRLRVAGKSVQVHRLAHELWLGPIPDGMCVCHTCDNPSCANPKHLFVGTRLDNNRDRDRKGRAAVGDRNGMSRKAREARMMA